MLADVGTGESDNGIDDRFEFDAEECSVIKGKWVFNSSVEPLYSDRTCPYLEKQITCAKNGRPDSDYLRWEWEQEDCFLPKYGQPFFWAI